MSVYETDVPHSLLYRHDEADRPLKAGRRLLIYFICGNPGLVDFYDGFFRRLHETIRSSSLIQERGTTIDIYGRDLAGFHDDDHRPFSAPDHLPYDLEGQVTTIYEDISEFVRQDKLQATKSGGEGYGDVILMGHSVGAYIATEIMHRHLQARRAVDGGAAAASHHVHMRHGFLLFPTLTQIALSRNGRWMQMLREVPFLDANFHVLAGRLLSLLPAAAVRWLVSRVLPLEGGGGGQEGGEGDLAGVLTRWLKSRDGVWQAVHLGKSEMEMIREEVWEESLWDTVAAADEEDGGEEKRKGVPRFFIFYGKEDEWVANEWRDRFIERRKRDGGETRIEVDEGDIPHAFSLKRGEYLWLLRDGFGRDC